MNLLIRPFNKDDFDELTRLTLLAFEPVFSSFESILGPKIYPIIYPDWRKRQQEAIHKLTTQENVSFWIADVDGKLAGFVAYEIYSKDNTGEVQLIAVHPDYQNQGIGTKLNIFALQQMKEEGIKLVEVATGGDASHAPARRAFEKAGYTALPLVRYYKDL